jgi:hypothetical protein
MHGPCKAGGSGTDKQTELVNHIARILDLRPPPICYKFAVYLITEIPHLAAAERIA